MYGIDFAEKAVERELTTKWKPIFKMMEQYPGFEIPAHVDEAFVQSSFAAAAEYLKSRVGHVWRRAKGLGVSMCSGVRSKSMAQCRTS